eukprot:gene3314-8258_t
MTTVNRMTPPHANDQLKRCGNNSDMIELCSERAQLTSHRHFIPAWTLPQLG